MSPRSTTTNPNPPLCKSKSVTLSAFSNPLKVAARFPELVPHRTHRTRLKSTPAPSADAGWNASLASTTAQNSRLDWPPVTCASTESINDVLPDEPAPQISVSAPRGKPPVLFPVSLAIAASTSAIPVENTSTAGFSRTVSAEGIFLARLDSTCARTTSAREIGIAEPERDTMQETSDAGNRAKHLTADKRQIRMDQAKVTLTLRLCSTEPKPKVERL